MKIGAWIIGVAIALGHPGFRNAHAQQGAIWAKFRDGQGVSIGSARLKELADGVQIRVVVRDLQTGPHGIHLHEKGACEGPDFKSAGSHYNPAGRKHGLQNPEGHHAGDLPNLDADLDGNAKATFKAKGVKLEELRGRSLVIHAGPDDQKSDPAGGAGGRVACGEIPK